MNKYALVEDQKMEKNTFFSFLIKINIRAWIWGALLTENIPQPELQVKIHVFRKV